MGTRKQKICDKCGEDLTEEEGYLTVNREQGTKWSGILKPTIASKKYWHFCNSCWIDILMKVDLAEKLHLEGDFVFGNTTIATKDQIEGRSIYKQYSEKFGED